MIGKKLVKNLHMRRNSQTSNDSLLNKKAFEKYSNQFPELKRVIGKRFREAAPKDFRLYDEVEVC